MPNAGAPSERPCGGAGDRTGRGAAAGGEERIRPAATTVVVERSFAWATRVRRLANDDERLPATVAGLHFVAFAYLIIHELLLPTIASP